VLLALAICGPACYFWNTDLHGAVTWLLPKLHLKYPESFKKCCCRRSVGPIVREMKKYYIESRRRGVSYIQYKEERLFGSHLV
jgi:hypothetical protein